MLREAAATEVVALRGVRLPGRRGVWTVTVREGRIVGIEPGGGPGGGPAVQGGLLVPGFHDPHVHVLSMLRERDAVRLPRALRGREALAAALRTAAAEGGDWLRVRGFDHDAMLGGWLPDRAWLDAAVPDRPLRVQHRNLRLDLLNSAGARRCGVDGPVIHAGHRLHDPTDRLDLHGLAQSLAADLLAQGVTSLQDAGEANGEDELALLAELAPALRVRLWTMVSGRELAAGRVQPGRRVRHAKLVAHEARLDVDDLVAQARAARRHGLGVAIHAATEVELAAAVAVLEAVGARRDDRLRTSAAAGHDDAGRVVPDRIEHAFVASDAAVEAVVATGAAVVASPQLMADHGDEYRARHARAEHPHLHRLGAWRRAGVPLALASDAPVTPVAPLRMLAATRGRGDESLNAATALTACTRTPARLVGARTLGRIVPGAPADLAVIRDGAVVLTLLRGVIAHEAR